jgi:ABC-2 type transport system permease protein
VTAMTATAGTTAGGIDDRRARTTLWHTIQSEWIKIWSVRSTAWTLLTLVIVTIGFSTLIAWAESSHLDQLNPVQRAQLDVTNNAMAGLAFGQLAIAVLGALVITSEYSTGGIKATLTAVPNRLRVLLAKAVVFAVVSFAIGLITAFGAFFISMIFWNQKHLAASLGDPGVLRAVIGGGLYVLASGMFGFALGTLIRHTAGSITAAVGLLFVAPPLTALLPDTWGKDINKYFTSNAGQHITEVVHLPGAMSPWTGYMVITLWWLIPLLAGAYLMKRRDA